MAPGNARVVLCVMKRRVRAATGFVPRPSRFDLIERGRLLATVILPWRIAGARPLPLIDALRGVASANRGWARGWAVQRRCVAGHRSALS